MSAATPAANAERIERMQRLLRERFDPARLEIIDDSHRHVGHAGARDGRGHFRLEIVAAGFEGMPSLARHRAVYEALGGMMQTDIHALAIRALAPSEA